MLKGSSTCLYRCTYAVDLFGKKNRRQSSRRDVSDECFIGAKQHSNLSICAIIPSRCKTRALLYAGSKTLVFEMDATSR